MKVTIIREDDSLILDGDYNQYDCSSFHQDFWALHFDTETETGEIEWINPHTNQVVSSISEVNTALSCDLSDLVESITSLNGIPAEFTALSEEDRKIFALEEIRHQRGVLLQESDWIGLSENSGKYSDAWKAYRQKLKDIPQDIVSGDIAAPTFNDSAEIVFTWPSKPE